MQRTWNNSLLLGELERLKEMRQTRNLIMALDALDCIKMIDTGIYKEVEKELDPERIQEVILRLKSE